MLWLLKFIELNWRILIQRAIASRFSFDVEIANCTLFQSKRNGFKATSDVKMRECVSVCECRNRWANEIKVIPLYDHFPCFFGDQCPIRGNSKNGFYFVVKSFMYFISICVMQLIDFKWKCVCQTHQPTKRTNEWVENQTIDYFKRRTLLIDGFHLRMAMKSWIWIDLAFFVQTNQTCVPKNCKKIYYVFFYANFMYKYELIWFRYDISLPQRVTVLQNTFNLISINYYLHGINLLSCGILDLIQSHSGWF